MVHFHGSVFYQILSREKIISLILFLGLFDFSFDYFRFVIIIMHELVMKA